MSESLLFFFVHFYFDASVSSTMQLVITSAKEVSVCLGSLVGLLGWITQKTIQHLSIKLGWRMGRPH